METGYWRGATHDRDMQDRHLFVWRALVDTVDVDLSGRQVLDAGCNRGGFLRLLADRCGIARGFGYDPAAGAVEDARRLAGGRPLHFQVADTVPGDWTGLDVAFSHEVLYVLHDLPAHAAAVHHALRPGGVYFAVMGVHAGAPRMAEWHAANRAELDLPPLRRIDDVVATFTAAGFQASVGRLALRFVPVTPPDSSVGEGVLDRLAYYLEHKLVLRMARPVG